MRASRPTRRSRLSPRPSRTRWTAAGCPTRRVAPPAAGRGACRGGRAQAAERPGRAAAAAAAAVPRHLLTQPAPPFPGPGCRLAGAAWLAWGVAGGEAVVLREDRERVHARSLSPSPRLCLPHTHPTATTLGAGRGGAPAAVPRPARRPGSGSGSPTRPARAGRRPYDGGGGACVRVHVCRGGERGGEGSAGGWRSWWVWWRRGKKCGALLTVPNHAPAPLLCRHVPGILVGHHGCGWRWRRRQGGATEAKVCTPSARARSGLTEETEVMSVVRRVRRARILEPIHTFRFTRQNNKDGR